MTILRWPHGRLGSGDKCGPDDGPQCAGCKRFQANPAKLAWEKAVQMQKTVEAEARSAETQQAVIGIVTKMLADNSVLQSLREEVHGA